MARNVALRALSHSKGSGSRVLEPARRSGASTGPDGGVGNEERAEGEGVFQRHKEVFYEHLSVSDEIERLTATRNVAHVQSSQMYTAAR